MAFLEDSLRHNASVLWNIDVNDDVKLTEEKINLENARLLLGKDLISPVLMGLLDKFSVHITIT